MNTSDLAEPRRVEEKGRLRDVRNAKGNTRPTWEVLVHTVGSDSERSYSHNYANNNNKKRRGVKA
eukprot:CAMPEP_0195013532 /NCGR_PEP_ID=MMETSP0326_2-20130528/13591_1 /TAXON_ID=2866 ORGANISM="Crypthecodinium cohnii, Strain Seligo" /NCGR_SAMPLE_ID=MMETSP0326_2 /ASSEMBLY_ACC=CAM_ASM_000348 /LENGTH=64 /DNA_ID=CAMNT_0040024113 /DNA_START=253 /DNA_END=447 /DNA_ORIENTATION=+